MFLNYCKLSLASLPVLLQLTSINNNLIELFHKGGDKPELRCINYLFLIN